jgi:dipeptidyl aminopeptidase/acylaminoacyl peptidase
MLLLCLLLAAQVAFAADPITEAVERMARVGRSGSPSFSPDGSQIAFVSDLSGTPQIWIVSSHGGWPVQVTNGVDPVSFVVWSPAGDTLAFSLAPGGGMNSQIYIVKPDGTGLRRLSNGGRETNNLGRWTYDGKRLLAGSNTRTPDAIDAYLVDPGATAANWSLVAKLEGVGGLDEVTRDGRFGLLTRLRSRGSDDLYVINLADGKEHIVTAHEGPGSFFGAFTPDGRAIYLGTNKDRDMIALGRVSLAADGTPGPIQLVAGRDDAELDAIEINEQGTQAALLWNEAGREELAFLDLKTNRMTAGPAMPGELIGGLRYSRDGRQLALTISGAAANPDIWLLDIPTMKLRQITFSPHPGVNFAQLVKPELATFKADDGLPLTGWLYRPRGAPGAIPFVVSFHGGPEGQERPAFRSDYQALLLAGIGVFAPNVRGSSGFGKRFVNLDNGELRFNAIKDIHACVDYLVKSGNADAKRIGIMGGSYGGYMTLEGLTTYPDLFAAGVDLFGMVNFFTFFEHTEPWMAAISTIEYGDPKTQPDLLRRLSPLGSIEKIVSPTMVQHGANDTNVPVVEAEQVVANLKKRGVPVEYILFPDEGHGWRKTANRVRSTVEMVRFFSRYLHAQPAGASREVAP